MTAESNSSPFQQGDLRAFREALQAEIDQHRPFDRLQPGALTAFCEAELRNARESLSRNQGDSQPCVK